MKTCCRPVPANALQGVLRKHLARLQHSVCSTCLLFNLDLDYSACLEPTATQPIMMTARDYAVQQAKPPALHYQLLFNSIQIQPSSHSCRVAVISFPS